MEDEFKLLPLEGIHEPRIKLRALDRQSVVFLERRDSIRRVGFLNSITVRPSRKYAGMYETIDGWFRVEAGRAALRTHVPAIIKHDLSDFDTLALQITANAVRLETEPVEYCRHLRRIQQQDPTMTITQIAVMVGKSTKWVKDQMHLLQMSKDIQLKVDRGEIPLQSAYMLAKIPTRWRKDYVEAAMHLPTKEFCSVAAGLIKQFQEFVAQGKIDEKCLRGYTPRPYMRGVAEVNSELDVPKIAGLILVKENCKTLPEAFRAALLWVLNQDQDSVEKLKLKIERQSFKRDQEEANYEALDET